MSDTLTIDTTQFKKALREYAETTRKTIAQIVNQRAYNVAGRAMDLMKPAPGDEQGTRTRIKSYLQQRRGADRYVISKTGKKTRKKVKKSLQLVVANLIIQKRRSRRGLKGLYGQAMIAAEGAFTQASQVGVGFLKSPLVAIVRGLTDYQPPGRRMPIKTRWGRISIWPGSKGSGTVNPAKPGDNATATMKMNWNVKGMPKKVERLTTIPLQSAFNAEEAEMRRHVAEKLQKEADKINAK